MLDYDCILPNVINSKRVGIVQTWLSTIQESFLSVQMSEKGEFYPNIVMKNSISHSYVLELPQTVLDNNSILPSIIKNKAVGIVQR